MNVCWKNGRVREIGGKVNLQYSTVEGKRLLVRVIGRFVKLRVWESGIPLYIVGLMSWGLFNYFFLFRKWKLFSKQLMMVLASWWRVQNCILMDLNRSSHINRTDEVFATEVLPNPTDKQTHQAPENGKLVRVFQCTSYRSDVEYISNHSYVICGCRYETEEWSSQ